MAITAPSIKDDRLLELGRGSASDANVPLTEIPVSRVSAVAADKVRRHCGDDRAQLVDALIGPAT